MVDTTKSRSRGNVPESPEKVAGAPEIEITDGMALAGAVALAESDRRVEDEREIVSRVFRAMLAARS